MAQFVDPWAKTQRTTGGFVDPWAKQEPIEDQDEGRSVGQLAKDYSLSLLSGAVSVPKGIVGLADIIATPFRDDDTRTITEFLADNGVDFQRAQSIIRDDLKSDEGRAQRQEINEAFRSDGVLGGLKSLADNPSVAVESAIESVPAMLSLAGVTRVAALRIFGQAAKTATTAGASVEAAKLAGKAAVEKAMPKLAALSAGLEGAQVAGEQASEYAAGGDLGGKQAFSSLGAGATTAATAGIVNKLGAKVGLEDVEAMIAAGGLRKNAGGLLKNVGKGMIKEGVEEAPQSGFETMWQNFGEGKPIAEGAPQSATEGFVVGTLLGGFGGATSSAGRTPTISDDKESLDSGYQQAAANLESLYNEAVANGDTEMAEAIVARSKEVRNEYISRRKAIDPNFIGDIDPVVKAQEKFDAADNVDDMNQAAQEILAATDTPKTRLDTVNQEAIDALSAIQPQQDDVTARLESAAQQAPTFEQQMRSAAIDRALKSIESRNGVASPEEARILEEYGIGRPYDRIDDTLSIPNKQPQGARKIWTGGQPEGYKTENGAKLAMIQRKRAEPELQWTVEAMANGNFAVAGYDMAQGADFTSRVLQDTPATEVTIQPSQVAATDTTAQPNEEIVNSNPAESDSIKIKSNGQPFPTEKSAKASLPFRRNPGAEIVPVDGGYGVRVQPETSSEAMQSGGDVNQSPAIHAGYRISKIKVRQGEATVDRWSVQSEENAERERQGQRQIGGDTLVSSMEEATAEAERQAKKSSQDASKKRAQEAEIAEKERINAEKKADTIDGFLDGKTPMQAGKIRASLDKQYRFSDGKAMSVRQRIDAMAEAGSLETETYTEPKIKPMSRTQFNRATQREQDAHEKRMKEAGEKTVYLVNGSDLGKTAYDYAEHLKSKAAPGIVADTEISGRKNSAQPANNPAAQETNDSAPAPEQKTILNTPRQSYINQMAKAQGIKKGSPGYDTAIAKVENEYEAELDKAYAAMPFEEYNKLNPDTPESLNRQAYDQLRQDVDQQLNGQDALFSKSRESTTLAKAWMDIAALDGVFSYPSSKAVDMADIVADISSSLSVYEETSKPNDVIRAWRISPKEGTGYGYIIHYDNGTVQVSLKNYKQGNEGSAIYSAAGNYAVNNGLQFTVDKFGIGTVGRGRRMEGLISLALKFGTTDFIQPFGKNAGRWLDGNAEQNLQYMLEESYENAKARTPWIDDYEFDPATNRIVARSGSDTAVGNADRSGETGGIVDGKQPGREIGRTERRAIITGTILRRGRAAVSNGLLSKDRATGDIFQVLYSVARGDGVASTKNAHTATTIRAALEKAFPGVYAALENAGLARVITSEQLPDSIKNGRFSVTAYHGSPYRFDKFDSANMGKGEGAQAYGWGHYFADKEEVARYYVTPTFNGKTRTEIGTKELEALEFVSSHKTKDAALKAIDELLAGDFSFFSADKSRYEELKDIILGNDISPGSTYKVKLPPEDSYLLWDKTLSSQPKKIQEAVSGVQYIIETSLPKGEHVPAETGRELYAQLTEALQGRAFDAYEDFDNENYQKAASEYLHSLGISGIKYLDGASRDGGSGSYNYVVFDDNAIEIEDVYYSKDGRVLAYVANGKVTFVADNIPKGHNVKGLMLHEIGVHLKQMGKNNKDFEGIKKRMEFARKAGNKKVQAAFDRVPKDTKPHLVTEEAMGYLVENAPDTNLAQQVITWIKAKLKEWIRTVAKGRDLLALTRWANNITQDELVMLATAGVKSANADTATESGNEVMASRSQPQTETAEFKKWFGDSKVVDEDGAPLVVYHGTDSVFTEFSRTGDIGYHFGTEIAARDRAARVGGTGVLVEPVTLSQVEKDSLAALNGEIGGTPAADLYALLLRKLDSPRQDLRAQVEAMPADEIKQVKAEYLEKPDSIRFAERVDRAKAGEGFRVEVNGETVSMHRTVREANARAARLREQAAKPMALYLRIENPIRLPDLGVWPAQEIAKEAGFSKQEMEQVVEAGTAEQQYAAVRAILEAKGFDGIVYRNEVEHAGEDSYIAFSPEQIKSALGNSGEFSPDTGDIRYSRADSSGFAVPDETLTTVAIRKIQDKFKVLKDLQANIKKAGGTVTEQNDAYLAEELFHGKAENDLRLMRDQYVEPLAKKMAEFGISRAELDKYLYAKHAPERNAQIAKINPDMKDGGSGMTNAEATDILVDVRKSGKQGEYDQIAGIVYDMLKVQRDLIREGGLEEDGTIDAWEATYKHYVPLKGWAEDTKDQGIPGTGKGFNIRGKESQRALGRASEAASPTAYAISDLTEKLIRKRKNEVGNALLQLIQDNPNKDYWEVFTDDNPETDRRITKVRDQKTGEMVEQVRETAIPMAIMKDRYFTTKKDGKTYYMKLNDERLMRAMKNIGPETNNGLIRTLGAINRVMSSLNTSYSPEFIVSNFARDIQTAILNLQSEQSTEEGKAAGVKIAAQTVKDVPKAMRAIYASLRGKDLKGAAKEWQGYFDEFRESGAKTGWFNMKDLDGQAKDLENLVAMAQGGFKGGAMKWMKSSADVVENMNSAVENAVRLSAYVNARRAGLSQAKAASLAKNMTVNFNRKGEVGVLLNSLYMFANASIQGVANFARTMGTLKGDKRLKWSNLNNAQKIAIGLAAGSYFLAMLNRAGAGDDDDGENFYDKVPDYVKERNLVIMKSLFGGEPGEYWKIPLPYGYNIFHVLGDGMESLVSGAKPPSQVATNISLAALGSFSPIGFQDSQSVQGIILKNAAPTVMKPVVDIAMNENFMGSSIYNENFPFGTPKPDSALARRSTPEPYKRLAEWMNEVTGGSQYRPGAVDINPDVMQYVVDYFGGAAYGFFGSKVPDAIIRAASGVEMEPHRTPFLSRVSGKVLPYEDMDKFYSRRDEINQIDAEVKSLQGPERLAFLRENRDKLRLKGQIGTVEKQLKLLRRRRDSIYAKDLPLAERDKQLKEVEARMKEVVDRFNKSYATAESR